MTVIIQIRAGMGAGKSTLVRRMLQDHGGRVVERIDVGVQGRKMLDVWRCTGDLFVVGSYRLDSTSGAGGDPLYGKACSEVMRRYAARGHVLHEGARAANMRPNGELGSLVEMGVVWAVLDTPLDECIRRIYQRRIERQRNVGAPLNERRQAENYRRIARIAEEGAEGGIRLVALSDAKAYGQLHALLASGGWVCSTRH
jgi:hypothetical protein